MPVALIPSFLFYCYINGITPGPANLCSLSASLNAGKKVALRQWWGSRKVYLIFCLCRSSIYNLACNTYTEEYSVSRNEQAGEL